jgi:two-component sensor histidine kinase
MKTLKASLLSFLTFILFSSSVLSQEVLPDSVIELTESNDLIKRARGWQIAVEFYFDKEDSIQYKKALQQFNQLHLDELTKADRRKIVKAHSDFLKGNFQYSTGKRFLRKVIKNALEEDDSESAALFYQTLAPYYFYSFQYDSCNVNVDQAIALYAKVGNKKQVGELNMNKSAITYAKGDYEAAIKFAFQAIDLFKETKKPDKLAMAYLQLGNIYFFLEDYNQSLQYYELSFTAFKTTENSNGTYKALSNIGLINLMLKNYRTSVSQQLKSVRYFESNNRELEKGNTYLLLGEGYWKLGKNDSAKYYNNLSIESNLLAKHTVGVGQAYLTKSRILLDEENVPGALIAGRRSYQIADSIKHYESIKDAAEQLSLTYEELNQIDSSYRYLKIYKNFQDSLDLDLKVLENYAMKHQFQVEEAQFELLLAEERAKVQELLNETKQKQLIIAIVVAFCSILLLILAVGMLFRNEKLSRQLSGKQEQISEELEIKESLLNEIHHRVKNNLQVISSMLSLQTQYIPDERIQKVIEDCKSRINSMSLIHESLYKRKDGIEAPFSEYVEKLIPKLVEAYQIDQTKIKLEMNLEEIHLHLDQSVPCGLLINEIVSNALKHAFPKGENGQININLFKKEGIIHLEIADNGKGFSDETQIEKQESFGFLLIETLVYQLEAEMKYENKNGVKYQIKWKPNS